MYSMKEILIMAIPFFACGLGSVVIWLLAIITRIIERYVDLKITTLHKSMIERAESVNKVLGWLNNLAQCPYCGHSIILGHFNEDTKFICPECGETSVWRLADKSKKIRYVLEKLGKELDRNNPFDLTKNHKEENN